MTEPLSLKGCRHDILGHYLKAIGLLRVLARCADAPHRDSEAEGWWDMESACFCLRSTKYPTMEKLTEFFERHYRPTPVFSPWNTGGGLDEKKEVVFRPDQKPWHNYWAEHKIALLAHGFPSPKDDEIPCLPEKPFPLTVSQCELQSSEFILVQTQAGKQKKPVTKVQLSWSPEAKKRLFEGIAAQRTTLERGIKFTESVKKKFAEGKSDFLFDVEDETVIGALPTIPNVEVIVRTKESGKKAVMALLSKELESHLAANHALTLGRACFAAFQSDDANDALLLEKFRDQVSESAAEAFDAIYTTRASSRPSDNPLFLNRGDAGASEVFRTFWVFYREMQAGIATNVSTSLEGIGGESLRMPKGKGTPFYPDAVKSYNIGGGWVQENYPFTPLDYILAVEGAFALRGSAARTIGAGSKRFAAFPFVFDSGEEMVDDGNEVKGTASALWLPIWDRSTTYEELASFISDAQARLPGKDARFSGEFVRAINAQGVDAGFAGWQEFRFKMKGSRVPWVSTGTCVTRADRSERDAGTATLLNRALAPLDESYFLDQFDIAWKGSKADSQSPHPFRTRINSAMETAALEPTSHHCLALLEAIFAACRQMCVSKTFREKLNGGKRGEHVTFFTPLPMSEWHGLLRDLAAPEATSAAEFRIARALASIAGIWKKGDDAPRPVEPMMGSILPLKAGRSDWNLPDKDKRHRQDVWSGSDLCHDLATVLQRRYMDSLKHERPALVAVHGARLADVLAFLSGELDATRIARWTEAMSLIDWRFARSEKTIEDQAIDIADREKVDEDLVSIPPTYAALRMLMEVECEWQGQRASEWKKRRSQQPFTLLCQRSPSSLPLAVSEALRWLSIWGVRNPWGAKARSEKERVTGRYVVSLPHNQLTMDGETGQHLAARLAAAVCIPLAGEDRWQLARVITLPPGT